LVNEDENKIKKYIRISVDSVPKDLEDMLSFLDHEDWEMIGRTAHKMKSNAGYMGMFNVMPLLQELETMSPDLAHYDKIAATVDKLESESLLALEELKNILNSLGS
jgi:HPt (histidine-containing phosphotransfer) domain-containing protein